MDRTPAVYIVASRRNGTIYTGVTSDLPGRIYQHRHKTFKGFSAEHGCDRLVWFEVH
ncbi:GIY-YIG nuclease family protein [Sphingomonas soli]|uniref:GIY-YIG nuclease family protein n=1 Tax=Sphingomonas soli TaxID=266127 RepID=UPI000A9DAE2B